MTKRQHVFRQHGTNYPPEYWYIYGEWRTVAVSKLVVDIASQTPSREVVVNALNEVIDCHPIEHAINVSSERPGFLVKWGVPIPQRLFEAVLRFNAERRIAAASEQKEADNVEE